MTLILGFIFYQSRQVGAITETARPDGDITAGWASCTGAGCASAHYTTVDETSNSTADYVNTGEAGGGAEIEEYSMTSVAGAVNSVTQVDVTIYAHSVACNGNGTNCDTLEVSIIIDSVQETAQTCTMTTTNAICTKTFSGSWQGDDDLQVRIARTVVGGGNPSNADDDVLLTYVAADVTYTINYTPDAPTLSSPANLSTGVSLAPVFQTRTTDANSDYLRYKIDLCSTSNCSSIVRTIDQTASQTGWSGQDTQVGTAYVSSSVISGSTMANHTYQSPLLNPGTQYWWRAYAIDPGGTNTFSSASTINSFTTNQVPSAPVLSSPSNGATLVSITPQFQFRASDAESDYLRYKIDLCSTSNCSSIVRTIDQTASQTGWSGQDAQAGTAYVGSSVISGSTMANHTYQAPALNYNTQYWWRAYAIDPAGGNQFSSASTINSFITRDVPPLSDTLIMGGTQIMGGTIIEN